MPEETNNTNLKEEEKNQQQTETTETTTNSGENKGEKSKETEQNLKTTDNTKEAKTEENTSRDKNFILKDGKYLFAKGHTLSKGVNRKKPFSLREDLIKSLKRIKKKDGAKYKAIIDSYWSDKRMRAFLMEQIDGKATQSVNIGGNPQNPVRIIEVVPMEEPQTQEETQKQE